MASTYVNNLRLNEMGTGDASGTWGTTTNTNLELIGEALGFGTEAITTNADTHTTTVADGSTDPGRAMYLKYTGTLDSACTITIAPNTISRMQFIENGTSGSQNIIISQGSGANITIPAGDTKAVYLDGAGSGAAVVDAFASLSTVDLKVQDDLTVTDDVSIGGATTIGGVLDITDTTDSSDATGDTGALRTEGGASIAKKLFVGTDLDVDGTSNLDVVDIDGAVDMASTLGVSGVLTANAGVVVDNITIDGTEIDLSSGDLTLDVAGVIKLDADGAEIQIKDGGTEIGAINMASSNLNIDAKVADKDIVFRGIDGSSDVTALTLDMSDAGRAIFPTGVLIHDSTALANTTFDARDVDNVTSLNVQNNGATIQRSQSATAAPTLVFNKARGSLGSEADVNNGDFTGSITFRGYHGSSFSQTATIESKVSGTPGDSSDMPGTLLFSTSNDGSSTPTSRMEIDEDGVMKLTGGVQSGRQDLLFNNSYITITNGSSYSLSGILNTGCLIAIGQNRSNLGVTYDHCLLFAESGTAFTKLADPSDRFAINSATTSNKTNIYVNSNTIVILNEVGSDATYSIAAFVFQGN
jgi:hypothetical protein